MHTSGSTPKRGCTTGSPGRERACDCSGLIAALAFELALALGDDRP